MKPHYSIEYLEYCLSKAKNTKMCQGDCERHEKGVIPVRVICPKDPPYDWAYFAYCPGAIAEDERMGFVVLREGDDNFSPNSSGGVTP